MLIFCFICGGILIMGKKVDYSKKLKPIYIESIEANHIYINDCAEKTGKAVEYKIGNSWFKF